MSYAFSSFIKEAWSNPNSYLISNVILIASELGNCWLRSWLLAHWYWIVVSYTLAYTIIQPFNRQIIQF